MHIRKAKTALLWSSADILLRQGLNFCIAVALARMLSPENFGTIALLLLFTGIASAFVDSGLSSALIQRQDVSHTDESTVFWFNLFMGAAVALALSAVGPAVATFYDLPVLAPLTYVMAFNVFICALGSIHGTLLTKQLDFRTLTKIGAISAVVSGMVALVCAWKGLGVWALAVQTLVSSMMTTLLLWVFNSWRPLFVFSRDSAKRLFGFGGYLLASALLEIAYARGYTLLIGKYYSVRELGFYNRADEIKQLPVGLLSGILSRVAFPIFSATANDKAKLRAGLQLSVRGIMLLNIPLMLGLSAVAEPLVLTVFGEKWLPATPYMQVLCLAGIFWPLHVLNLNILMAQGHASLFFRLEIIKKVVGVCCLIVGSFYGVMGIAWSQVVFGFVAFLINAHYSRLFVDYGPLAQMRDFVPTLCAALPMAIVVNSLRAYWDWKAAPVLNLCLLIASGACIFCMTALALRVGAIRDARNLFASRN